MNPLVKQGANYNNKSPPHKMFKHVCFLFLFFQVHIWKEWANISMYLRINAESIICSVFGCLFNCKIVWPEIQKSLYYVYALESEGRCM